MSGHSLEREHLLDRRLFHQFLPGLIVAATSHKRRRRAGDHRRVLGVHSVHPIEHLKPPGLLGNPGDESDFRSLPFNGAIWANSIQLIVNSMELWGLILQPKRRMLNDVERLKRANRVFSCNSTQ